MKIVATKHVATDEFKSLSKEERRCMLSSEVLPESIFSSYDQEGGIFECTLKHAVRVTFSYFLQSTFKVETICSKKIALHGIIPYRMGKTWHHSAHHMWTG